VEWSDVVNEQPPLIVTAVFAFAAPGFEQAFAQSAPPLRSIESLGRLPCFDSVILPLASRML
jgi:hypothetical protein